MRPGTALATLDHMDGYDAPARPGPDQLSLQIRRLGTAVLSKDLLVASVLLVLQLGGAFAAEYHGRAPSHLDVDAWILVVVGPIALIVWRRHPVAVLWITLAATLGPSGSRSAYLSLVVAFFLAATGGHRRAAWAVIVVGYVGSLWLAPLVWGQSLPSLDAALILGGWLTVLVVAAEVVRMRRERAAERRVAHRVEERRRVSEDRLRMARDLHDVIGHNISLINVQATMGLDLIDADPAQARAALAAIKTVSKDAVGELRAMLAALRHDESDAPRQPAPGLDRLEELVEAARAAGLPVVTEVSGPRLALPSAVDLTAYRIIQESLTNATRHAPGAPVTIRITYQPHAVLLEVLDDGLVMTRIGAAENGWSGGPGSGITGMRERAAAVGGRVDAGVRPGGGFRVAARLPLDAPE